MFQNIDKKNCTLYVPKGTFQMYASAPIWMEFYNIVEVNYSESVTLDVDKCTILVGQTRQLNATVLPASAETKEVVWSSSDNSVASVSDGMVTGLKAGTACITAKTTDGTNLEASCIVYVYNGKITYADDGDISTSLSPVSGDAVEIMDSWKSLHITEDIDNVNVSYSRTYKNTSWQAWYVPFGFTLTSDIASRFSFAKFAGTYTEAGQFFITLVEMQEGDEIKGNVPYFVQAKVADSSNPQVLNISNTTLYATDASGFKMLSAEKEIAIYGTYAKKVAAADDDWYAYGGGKYIKATTGQSLGAFRFYLTIRDREDNPYASTPNPIEIKVVVLGDEADGISSLNGNDSENGTMFNLAGQPVGADYKGVVIRNGKKTFIH